MILYIFGEDVFLNLVDAHQHLVGHTPLELLAYLEDTYITNLQKRDDITLMDAQMRLPYSMDMMMEQYFKNMGTCQFTLASLGNAITDGEMICLCLVQFTKNDDLIEPCKKWEDQPANARTYADFQRFMIQQVIRFENRRGTLGTANIANLVEESTKISTEILSGELLIQAETIARLGAQLDDRKQSPPFPPSSGVPSMVNTDTSSVMSQQQQAMQVEINSLKAVAVVAAAAAAVVNPSLARCQTPKANQNDTDMEATVAWPYKQRSVCCYTHDNYCHTCSFDIAKNHTSTSCTWNGPNHNVAATITNCLGGTAKNCFHYKGAFTA